ncbi:hypothetical protein KC19_8G197500 [Ceratodon purpureus]|uniref:Uncharacterized protein n=1 Tax=Ceratodon purpureus TaxID=3225 RepID=A0A8T0H5E5_CERPU|nr:hypothetical protein KC19_8G197500 [Ceratodon purpureus]
MAGLEESKCAEGRTVFSSKSKFDTLQSRVLKWNTDDITSSTLFKVECIPEEFSSMEEYLEAFRVPFLEEVRATLHQALEKSTNQDNDGHAIFPVQLSKLMICMSAKNEDHSMWKFRLHSSRASQRSALPFRTSDLLLLCSEELPEWNAERECLANLQAPQKFLLVYVNNAKEESSVVSATACVQAGSPMLEKMTMASTSWHAVLLGLSLIPAERIWNSIIKASSSGRASKMFVMQDVLQITQQVVPAGTNSLALRQTPNGVGTLERVEEYCTSRRLNDSQRDVVKSALAGLLTPDVKSHVRMVQGPPGTGKTAMLVTLISVLGCLQYRTLISAPTNAAVLEVFKRMMSFFPVGQSYKEESLVSQQEIFSSFCARVRNSQSKTDSTSCQQCSPIELRDVVLVGSVRGMDGVVKGNALMEKVFLPYRIQRLTAALSPATGWKGYVQLVETFLTDSPAQFAWYYWYGNCTKDYDQFGKRMEIDSEKQEVAQNTAFWMFARERMIEMQARMEEHLLVLLSELPKCHIDVTTSKAMTMTFELMNSIINAMPLQPPVDATSWFSTPAVNITAPERIIADLSLSGGQTSSIDIVSKLNFLRIREALLEALASRPGCTLLATEQNPQGREPKDEWLRSQCFKNATLVFCTVSAAGSPLMATATFECAIIDEASQLVEAGSIVVSGMRDLKQLILVGDHKQLPGTVISKVAEKSGYSRSLFERLQNLRHSCRHMLNCQYRMMPEISHFPNSQFYESELKDGPNVLASDYGMEFANASPYGAYAFIDCGTGAEVAQPKGWSNPQEVAVVTKLVICLGKVCAERKIKSLSVGVISPYAMQVEALKQSLVQQRLNSALDVEVKSVDGFQGNERDVIIFSAVRANQSKLIGFLNDSRRLNVAITRGRYCVWIVGNAETLSGGGEIWKKLITDAKARKCFHEFTDQDLKVVIDV